MGHEHACFVSPGGWSSAPVTTSMHFVRPAESAASRALRRGRKSSWWGENSFRWNWASELSSIFCFNPLWASVAYYAKKFRDNRVNLKIVPWIIINFYLCFYGIMNQRQKKKSSQSRKRHFDAVKAKESGHPSAGQKQKSKEQAKPQPAPTSQPQSSKVSKL